MTQDMRPIGLLVRYATDIASARDTEQAARRIAHEVEGVDAVIKKLNLNAAQAKELRDQIVGLDTVGKSLGQTYLNDAVAAEKFQQELKRLSAENERFAESREAARGGGGLNDTAYMKAQVDAAHAAALQEEQNRRLKAEQLSISENLTREMTAQKVIAEHLAELGKDRAQAEKRASEVSRINSAVTSSGLNADAFSGASAAGAGNAQLVQNLKNLSNVLIAAPGIGYQSPIVVGVRALGVVAEKSGASVLSLVSGLGITAAVVAPLLVLFHAFNELLKEFRTGVQAAIDANADYYKALQQNSTAATADQKRELQDRNRFLAQEMERLRAAMDSGFRAASQGLSDPLARLLDNQTGISQLREQYESANKEYLTNANLLERLSQGLAEGAFHANDLREETERYWQGVANATLSADKLTADGRAERLRAIERELELYGELGQLSSEQQSHVEDLHLEYSVLSRVQDTYADQLEREKETKQKILDLAQDLQEIDQLDYEGRQNRIAELRKEIDFNNLAIAQRTQKETTPVATYNPQTGLYDVDMTPLDEGAEAARESLRQQNAELEAMIGLLTMAGETTADFNTAQEYHNQLTRSGVESVNRETEIYVRANQMTREERQKEIASIQFQIDTIRDQQKRTDLTSEAVDELNKQLYDLQLQQTILAKVTESYGDQLEREQKLKDLIKATGEELVEAYKIEGEARDKLIKLQSELTEAENEHTAALEKIENQKNEKIQAAAEKRADDERELREKSATELGTALEKIQKDSDARIEQIRLNSTRSILRLIARGDQAAAIEALEDQAAAIADERKKRLDAEEQKKKDIKDKLDDQLKAIKDRYDDQVKAAEKAARDAVAAQNERWRKEKADRDQAIREAQTALRNAMANSLAIEEQYRANSRALAQMHNNAQYGIFSGGLSDIRGAIINWINDVIGFVRGLGSTSSSSSSSSSRPLSSAGYPPLSDSYGNILQNGVSNSIEARMMHGGFDEGGYNTKPGWYWSGIPEVHIPMTDVNRFVESQGGSGRNITINVHPSQGMNEQQLAGLVVKKVKELEPAMTSRIASNMGAIQFKERQRRFGGNV